LDIESVNQHFLTVAQKTIDDVPLSVTSPLSHISVSDVPDIRLGEIDEGEVYRHICDLNIHQAVGVDNISKFIKASSSSMAVLHTKLIHKSIRSHTFPDV